MNKLVKALIFSAALAAATNSLADNSISVSVVMFDSGGTLAQNGNAYTVTIPKGQFANFAVKYCLANGATSAILPAEFHSGTYNADYWPGFFYSRMPTPPAGIPAEAIYNFGQPIYLGNGSPSCVYMGLSNRGDDNAQLLISTYNTKMSPQAAPSTLTLNVSMV
ncbi:MAG: hypothetical protein K5Q00_04450 [Gammaproteobacteria bacterium]|nr:hypothetical protein [Gammaproteobacteria bacterium]